MPTRNDTIPDSHDSKANHVHADQVHGKVSRSIAARWAPILDEAFQIPGTNIKIGWDAIIGFVPVLGDTIGLGMSTILLIEARVRGVRFPVLLRMAGWILLDALVGSVPLVGDIADIFIKPNMRLLRMLERELEAKEMKRQSN
jgi:hypothetical protein